MSSNNRRKIAAALATLTLGASLLAGCSLIPKDEENLKPPLVKPAKPDYQTVQAKKGAIVKEVKGVANFESTNVAYEQFNVQGGRVHKVLVSAGDMVHKGDVLVQLELNNLDMDVLQRKLDIANAQVELDDAKASGSLDLINAKRLKLEIAQKAYEKTEAQYQETQLKAEMDGQVTFVEDLKPGDSVSPYQPIVNIADPNHLRLSYQSISVGDLNAVEVGMNAEVTYKGRKYQGKVVQTPNSAPLTDNQQLAEKYSKTLYINLADQPKDAEIGGMADIRIVTQQKDNVIVLPLRALRSYLGRNFVQILDGEAVREIDVEVGIKTPTEVEIVKGLNEGQTVILQ